MQIRTIPFDHKARSKLVTTGGGNAYGPCVQYVCVGMYRTSSVVIFMNGHFLRPTTSAKSHSWVSTIVLGEKNLAPSKVGQTENFQICLMDYLTNFSFEIFHEIFTEDASLPFLYHGAKKSKMTKNSNQGGVLP